ncbi:MAG: leucine-rich repeat protein [Clostridia bacterium]|nr:leucine-rich repeat protein [Clostridia bacterium]
MRDTDILRDYGIGLAHQGDLLAFTYDVTQDGSIVITGLKDKLALAISIPEGTVEISDGAFCRCGFFSAYVPESTKRIGSRAFFGCKRLRQVRLPDFPTLSIAENAFEECPELLPTGYKYYPATV